MKHTIFKYAIVRKPSANFADGITSSNLGIPILEKAIMQHKSYCKALEKCGLSLIVLEPDIRYPDSPFVEDTAIVTEECAVIALPGHPARCGEEDSIREVLSRYRKLKSIEPPGTVDGGDVLRAEDHFFIGLSGRTNEEGAGQLESILTVHGYTASILGPTNLLHLKSGANYLGNDNLVITRELAHMRVFERFNRIVIDESEGYAANSLLINEYLLIPAGYPGTREKLQTLGHEIIELEMSEFRKMDGGLTCLSLRF